ncbi:MAG: cyclase family protein [Christensenellaceae bacterium]|jgi:kynurenine formamidase
MKTIDLSHVLHEQISVFPGTPQPVFGSAATYEAHGYRETKICMYSHVGTHVDVPAHIFPNGRTISDYAPSAFIGRAVTVDCTGLAGGAEVPLERVGQLRPMADTAEFLLFYTGYSAKWGSESYLTGYPVLSDEMMQYIINGGYKGVGFDTLGPDAAQDEALSRHLELLKNGLLIYENLANLEQLGERPFTFIGLPLNIEGAEGAPCRAVALLDE